MAWNLSGHVFQIGWPKEVADGPGANVCGWGTVRRNSRTRRSDLAVSKQTELFSANAWRSAPASDSGREDGSVGCSYEGKSPAIPRIKIGHDPRLHAPRLDWCHRSGRAAIPRS